MSGEGTEERSASEDAGDPMDTEEPVASEGLDAPDAPESDEEEGVDLKGMADDYAKYLIVNSKQDVRELAIL